jgi:hypothetical protein
MTVIRSIAVIPEAVVVYQRGTLRLLDWRQLDKTPQIPPLRMPWEPDGEQTNSFKPVT